MFQVTQQMKGPVNPKLSDTMIRYYIVFSQLLDRQDEEMDYLNIFIDYQYKSIVSIIWAKAHPYSSLVPC